MTNKIIDNIINHYKDEYKEVPNKENLFNWIDELFDFLFPLYPPNEGILQQKLDKNKEDFKKLIQHSVKNVGKINELTDLFYSQLTNLHSDLIKDAEKFINSDPAAKCMGEILHTYPGFYAIAIYRMAHHIHENLKIKYIPRMLTEYAHGKTGIDIHPGAKIDVPFLIDHGTGVVIGETCEIGKNVSIYQGVTLGALQVEKELQNTKRHPTIENDVIIYANATILGGKTIIGNNSVIGGNVFLTKSIPPYSLVYNKLHTQVKDIKLT